MEKEKLEKELQELNTKYMIIINRISSTKQDLIAMNNEALMIKGAKEQVEKLLAFYNNEEVDKTTKKNKKEEK
ncbi:hypothetical protein [uncultured Clostridium sp.]|uniref:hypothetical protein n=1 Tax=uncultured Clostridium sp. TaxID=59620 RepID=UPI00260C3030|nr:hypothetical protein [uncultured Clostridium sp.]